jgi:hypothetical protein
MLRTKVCCPYCGTRFRCAEIATRDVFKIGDAMICCHCGQVGSLGPDWTVRPSTPEDIGRWMCTNPILWEKMEMMMSRWRRQAAERAAGGE